MSDESERERQRDRETDGQAIRQTDKQTERERTMSVRKNEKESVSMCVYVCKGERCR